MLTDMFVTLQAKNRLMAYFDGDTRVPMKTGDRIVIKKARRDTLIVKISNISFLETLRKKMANI